MSDSPEKPKPVDLSAFQILPDWVAQLGAEPPKHFEESRETERERESSWERRDRPGGRGRDGGRDFRGPRDGARGREPQGRRGPGDRDGRGPRPGQEGGPGERREGEHGDRRRPPGRLCLPEGLGVEVLVTPAFLDALVSRIRMSGRAVGMFDVAKVVLDARERIEVEFRRTDPEKAPRLYRSGEGEGMALWLDRNEGSRRMLRDGAMETYYRQEETEVEPPKGDFKAVAVCGLSGQVIAPPNHHSFQTAVVRLHRERYGKMPLASYKARIRTETSEELVNRWKEEQSRQTRYVYPREAVEGVEEVVLDSQEAVERHFLSELSEGLIREVDRATVPGQIPGKQLSGDLLTYLRQEVESLQRNPFELVKRLCGQMERRGLKIFKRQGKKLFVSKSRPRAIEPDVVLSDDVAAIIYEIRARPGIKVSELVTFLAPRESGKGELKAGELTPQETAILTHLRWLIDEGFIIEYAATDLYLGVQASSKEAGRDEGGEVSEGVMVAEGGLAEEVALGDRVGEGIAEEGAVELEVETAMEEVETVATEIETAVEEKTGEELGGEGASELEADTAMEEAEATVVEAEEEELAAGDVLVADEGKGIEPLGEEEAVAGDAAVAALQIRKEEALSAESECSGEAEGAKNLSADAGEALEMGEEEEVDVASLEEEKVDEEMEAAGGAEEAERLAEEREEVKVAT